MELRHIRYFLAVAEERHFTRAALRLNIAQPPLSQQIKDLENEVGAPLFRRLSHGAELTDAGKAFMEVVKDMPLTANRAIKSAQKAIRAEVGIIRVGFTASSAFNRILSDSIKNFCRKYPDVAVELEEANTTRLIDGLQEGTLDVAFIRPGFAGSERFQLRTLCEEPMCAVIPEQHALAKKETVAIKELENESFLLFPRQIGPNLYDTVIDACREAGFSPNISQLVPQITSVINLVAAELGVSIVPSSMSQLVASGVVYRPLEAPVPLAKLALAYRRGDSSQIVKNFVLNTI